MVPAILLGLLILVYLYLEYGGSCMKDDASDTSSTTTVTQSSNHSQARALTEVGSTSERREPPALRPVKPLERFESFKSEPEPQSQPIVPQSRPTVTPAPMISPPRSPPGTSGNLRYLALPEGSPELYLQN